MRWWKSGSKGDVMGKAFESIRQGLTEAIDHAKGKKAGVKLWRPKPVDVAAVRGRVGFTQAQFAARFGVSVATLRHWERGDRSPQGPALVLLNLIDRDPAGVLRLLGGAKSAHVAARIAD
jgi:putative transcriptional regulator